MNPSDISSDFIVDDSGSRLLSESLIHSSHSLPSTGHGGDDLSLSELLVEDRPPPARRRPFSLLAQPRSLTLDDGAPDDSLIAEEDEEDVFGETMRPEDAENARKLAARTREEKLQSDLYMLKKLNSAFELYKDALKEAKSSTERVTGQLVHTNALLDKYVNILSKSEKVTRLILDERWEGATADEEQIEHELREELERRRREEEERRLAEQRERERIEREQREREAKLEQERLERERAESAKTVSRGSGVRGVRGTRASMRGMTARGTARPGSISMPRPSSGSSLHTPPGGIPVRRTTSSSSARGTTPSSRARPSGIARPRS